MDPVFPLFMLMMSTWNILNVYIKLDGIPIGTHIIYIVINI